MRRAAEAVELGGPVVLVVLTALFGTTVSLATETYVINTLVAVGIVVALYVFIGSSGVLSFGHISFVAVGAWTAGVLSVPQSEKPAIMNVLYAFGRPFLVAEWALEREDDPAWVQRMFAWVATHPRTVGLVYFDKGWSGGSGVYQLGSKPRGLAVYRREIKNPRFAAAAPG